MKRIKTRALTLLLSCSVLATGIVGGYEKVQAASLSAGAALAGESLSFLESLFMAGGMSLGLDMILKTQNDINNWDWGEVLDSPASQGQIDKANETIEKLYNNAVKDWHEKHGGSSDPTPTPLPDVSPPVTVAPINPDDVAPPEDWGTLKKNAQDKGILALGAATAYCVKEAVKGWWDDIFGSDPAVQYTENPYVYKDLIGSYTLTFYCEQRGGFYGNYTTYFYDTDHNISNLRVEKYTMSGDILHSIHTPNTSPSKEFSYYSIDRHDYINRKPFVETNKGKTFSRSVYPPSESSNVVESINLYVPYTMDGIEHEAQLKPLGKSSIWPSTDLKDDYDNNRSPNLPELVTPVLRLPTLDEIKNLWQQGSGDEDNRPIYVTNFITDHVVQTTPEPEPSDKPDAKPTPTIAVVPDPGGGSGSGGSGSGTNPDNPKPEKPEDEVKPYTADLKDVFPFCIPFDLIHLFEVFDAEPEAPVFEIPIDLQVDNPFTGASIVSYKDTIKIDLSDYEEPIKVIRVFEVIFFLIGLMLITRSHMIKG